VETLKQLVNNKKLYDAFLEHLDNEIELSRKALEQANDDNYKVFQGEIRLARKLQKLREKVNNG